MRVLLTIFCTIVLFSCKGKKDDVVIIHSPDDFYEKLEFTDTACVNARKRAESDLARGRIIVNIDKINPSKPYFDIKRMIWKLKQFNLSLDTIRVGKNHTEDGIKKISRVTCYQDAMNNAIYRKYNLTFVDSLVKEVQKEYVLEHPDKIFEFKECDSESGTKSETQFHRMIIKNKVDLLMILDYPDGYVQDDAQNKTVAEFIVLKDGTVKDITAVSTFGNTANLQFKPYFEEIVSSFIKKAKWMPATSSGILVNARFKVVFEHR